MYEPGPLPIDAPDWMRRELLSISEASRKPVAFLYTDKRAKDIDRPRDGMLALFDGTNIDQGSGVGAYIYFDGEWHYLGGSSEVPVKTVTNTSYTIGATDYGYWIEANNGSAMTFELPAINMNGALGKSIIVRQKGDGQVTFTAGSGATVQCAGTAKTRAKYSAVGLQLVADDTWAVVGDYA